MDFTLYEKARDADKALSEGLIKHFGRKASDMRYRLLSLPFLPDDLRELRDAKVKADEDWLEHVRKERENAKI